MGVRIPIVPMCPSHDKHSLEGICAYDRINGPCGRFSRMASRRPQFDRPSGKTLFNRYKDGSS